MPLERQLSFDQFLVKNDEASLPIPKSSLYYN